MQFHNPWRKGVWKKGKQIQTGSWIYNYGPNNFTISLNSVDPVTGQPRIFKAYGDLPEWGKWKLQK